ncbi:MAG: glutamate-5-semialdehyde dehydrogenase [Phycisphaerae bacterium]
MMQPIEEMAAAARAASRAVASLSTETKNAVLRDLADRMQERADAILEANRHDVGTARESGLPEAKLKRLTLTPETVAQMSDGLRQVAELSDPVGQITRKYTAPSGLEVSKVRAPLGVIMMIYEARPNVTIDAFALCFKSGNACILKGGKEAARSNTALARLAREVLTKNGVTTDAIALLTTSDREAIKRLLRLDQYIDLVIPRGGTELIRFVHEHSHIPTVQHFQGVCHIFVDASADTKQALDICTTAKTSAPATCNAAEALLVHQDIATEFVPTLVDSFHDSGVEVRGDAAVCALASKATPATDEDWGHEFLDLIIAVKVVKDIHAAISHIAAFGSNHTDAILTADEDHARLFTDSVQSSCTLVNASTRFNDGFQLGLGAEIGISTSKIHAYGPMGLEELTTQRYVVRGTGQYR